MRVSASLQQVGDGGRLNCAVAMISAGSGGARRQICHAGYVRWANHGHNNMMQVASTSQREWHTLGGGGSSSSTWSWRLQQRVRGGGHRGAAAVSRSELRGSAADDEEEAEAQVRPPSPDPLGISTRNLQQYTYLFAALASSVGITSLAAASVYYRFAWQMQGGEISYLEMFGCLSLALGAAVGMEFWARWAHRALWHASLWHMHEELQEVGGQRELDKLLLSRKQNSSSDRHTIDV